MSDSRLLALERRFLETRSATDELPWLVALLRSGGSLTWERYRRLSELDSEAAAGFLGERASGLFSVGALRAAAACGDTACRCLADFLPIPKDWFDDPRGQERLAEHFSQIALVSEALALRVALVCVEAALPGWEGAQDDSTPRELFVAASTWVEMRQPNALARAKELRRNLREYRLQEEGVGGQALEVALLTHSLVDALSAVDSSTITRDADLRRALGGLGQRLPAALDAPASVVVELLLEVVVRPLLAEALDDPAS